MDWVTFVTLFFYPFFPYYCINQSQLNPKIMSHSYDLPEKHETLTALLTATDAALFNACRSNIRLCTSLISCTLDAKQLRVLKRSAYESVNRYESQVNMLRLYGCKNLNASYFNLKLLRSSLNKFDKDFAYFLLSLSK